MKKHLIIAFAICVLFLSACSSLPTTSTSPGNVVAPVTTTSAQSVCQVLQGRHAQLSQQYQAARAQFSAAQFQGNAQQVGEAEKALIRLHQSIVQVQAQTKAC